MFSVSLPIYTVTCARKGEHTLMAYAQPQFPEMTLGRMHICYFLQVSGTIPSGRGVFEGTEATLLLSNVNCMFNLFHLLQEYCPSGQLKVSMYRLWPAQRVLWKINVQGEYWKARRSWSYTYCCCPMSTGSLIYWTYYSNTAILANWKFERNICDLLNEVLWMQCFYTSDLCLLQVVIKFILVFGQIR